MFLTAHLVEQNLGPRGINAFFYLHGHSLGDPTRLDVEGTLQRDPGSIIAAECAIPPGNLHILAYVDILGDDDLTIHDLQSARRTSTQLVQNDANLSTKPIHIVIGRAVVHAGATVGRIRSGEFQASDISGLWDRIESIWSRRPQPSWIQPRTPLTVLVRLEGGKLRYELDGPSFDRIHARNGARWRRRSFSVDSDEVQDIEAAVGNVEPIMIEALTGLALPEVQALGGLVIAPAVDPRRIIWQWPRPPAPNA